MSDSIERLFPISPAGSSKPGNRAASYDERTAAPSPQRRSVRPIPALVLTHILDHRPNLYERLAANDRAYREAERRATGGTVGFAIMFAVTLVIALMLATGGVR